jgi:rfaE bifunctional protein kinase chain/domain/rfaE bifunctional protein nucleotidyltransferase chain/domain
MSNSSSADYTSHPKIVTLESLLKLVGPFPRKEKLVMCHGTFDLVHPGHIRHLIYAKNQGSKLLVSLTSDEFITKANYRPIIPQNLRAFNLASLEFVDYVLIDDNPKPLANISKIQPDYFAKGYDYVSGGVHPRTQEEIEVLRNYGGEMVLTPGDVVFSSSHFIEKSPPNIGVEKLNALMASENVTFNDLRKTIDLFPQIKVHVLGDSILDTYAFCSVIGSSTSKTPTISTRLENEANFVGGAGAVASHIKASGASVKFTTMLGNDPHGNLIQSELEGFGISVLGIKEVNRPTTNKKVFIADNHRLLKVDVVENRPISEKSILEISHHLKSSDSDLFVFSDFRHGIFNQRSTKDFINAIPNGKMKVGDSQVASRWGNILDFQEFDLLTPNEKEARFALADQDSVVRALCSELYSKANARNVILKMGSRGLMYQFAQPGSKKEYFQIDSLAENIVDPVGAGDALLAYASLALYTSKNSIISGIIGAISAGIACGLEGNSPIKPEDLSSRINRLEKELKYE